MKIANPVSCTLKGAALATALLFSGCGQPDSMAGKPAVVKEPQSISVWFKINLGGKILRMQLAVRPKELERGLMERRDLGPDDAMVFVFERPQPMSFWMRNTPTPLDIAYFSPEGTLVEYYPGYPFDEKSLPSRSQRLQFVVETHQGWFQAHGIKPGAQLDLSALSAALTARGFDPRKFGLQR
jgi:hypothetical protein